jgi:hypothetical protein
MLRESLVLIFKWKKLWSTVRMRDRAHSALAVFIILWVEVLLVNSMRICSSPHAYSVSWHIRTGKTQLPQKTTSSKKLYYCLWASLSCILVSWVPGQQQHSTREPFLPFSLFDMNSTCQSPANGWRNDFAGEARSWSWCRTSCVVLSVTPGRLPPTWVSRLLCLQFSVHLLDNALWWCWNTEIVLKAAWHWTSP